MRASLGTIVLAAATLTLAAPRDARACGGFFCDNPAPGQPPMPVDQTGETIVFAFDGDQVEAHISIQYTGDPERFAWLIPLQAVPEITVGSAQLFLNLLNGTVPTVTVTPSFDACNSGSSSSSSSSVFSCGSSDESASGAASGFGGSAGVGGGGPGNIPPVAPPQLVGAFEVSIVSGSGADVETWLVENGYLPDDEAPDIVDEYAAQGYVFAAIKLQAGAGLDELHPLIVKYRGTEPCIPLKLTRIAAKEDMGVRAFFLGERRTVPTSYRHVELNFARFDWANRGSNYVDLVTQAVDSPGADGRAFVTEYAGPSSVVSTEGLTSNTWNANAFAALSAFQVVEELERQGLMSCSSALNCVASHPQVFPLLRNHLPAPPGIADGEFWANTALYAQEFDASAFDPAAFSRDVAERIVEPGNHARDLLAGSPYLTRLFTTISPAEMTEDPMFAELPAGNSAGDVTSALAATDRRTCDAKQVMNLPDGREVAHQPNTWVPFAEAMPWAERIDEFGSDGSRIELKNFGATIDRELQASNIAQGYDPGAPDREVLSDASGGGACACQMRSMNAHGVAFLVFGVLGLLRRVGSARRASGKK
jgi:hypothetical protein